jgi:hypothetical protein
MAASEVPTWALRNSKTPKFNHCILIKYIRDTETQMVAV